MSNRTDLHRPSALVPADYVHVLVFATPGVNEPFGHNLDVLRHMMETEKFFGRSRANCDVCGAHFRYGSVFRHTSGEHIVVGWECAEKIGRTHQIRVHMAGKRHALQNLDRARKRSSLRIAQRAMLKASPGLNRALKASHYISRDLRGSAIRWGSLSEKQVKLAFDVAAREAEKKTERLVPVPAEGRVTIRGRIVSIKTSLSMYGLKQRMTVKIETADGAWLANGTYPQKIGDQAHTLGLSQNFEDIRGLEVEFSAEVEKSDKPHFGFYKRPTKIKVIGRAPMQEQPPQ